MTSIAENQQIYTLRTDSAHAHVQHFSGSSTK